MSKLEDPTTNGGSEGDDHVESGEADMVEALGAQFTFQTLHVRPSNVVLRLASV